MSSLDRSYPDWIVAPVLRTHTIEHSGEKWTTSTFVWPNSAPQGRDPVPLWPVSEFMARWKPSAQMAKRLVDMNPDGVPEGEYPKGWKNANT